MFMEIPSGQDGSDGLFSLIARRLKAMADPARVRILHSLCRGERNVTELVNQTGYGQANVSKHLRILREEGLVETRRERRMIYYRLTSSMSSDICERICRSFEQDQTRNEKLLETRGENG